MDFGLLTDVLNAIETGAARWTGVLASYGLRLFYLLSILDLAWVGIRYMLAPSSAGGSLAQFVSTIITWMLRQGAFFALLTLWPVLVPSMLASFRQVAAAASSASSVPAIDGVTPSYFLLQGADIVVTMFDSFGVLGLLVSPVSAGCLFIASAIVLAAFFLMAAALVLTIAESYIAIAAGSLLFGFAGCRWTASIADGVLSYGFRIGVRVFLTYLIANLFSAIVSDWAATTDFRTIFGSLASTLVLSLSCLTVGLLMWHIPRVASNLVPPGNLFRF